MRRLLFVDDEVPILRALERMLRTHRRDWECHFVDDPVRALALLDDVRPDAVVSDMLMPGMDGAEFLTEAARRRPLMARFILSGEVGAGSLIRMARAAHQCLAKPCRGDVLMDVLRRALLDPSAVREPAVLEVLYGLSSLPVSAPRFDAVRRLLGQPGSDARDEAAVNLIAGSPGLTTKLLQVATWTRLGMGAPPAHVHDAFFQLGADAVAALLDSDLLKPVPGGATTPFQRDMWRRGARAAATGHALALAEGCSVDQARHVALSALWGTAAPVLFDLACRDLHATLRAEADATGTPLPELERRAFGLTAGEAFAQLLRLWGLSPSMADGVALGDTAAPQPGEPLGIETLGRAARAVADTLDGVAVSPDTVAFLEVCGAGGRVERWRQVAAAATEPIAA
ncbi:MAG: response regulator [Vicinamibacterales bacterium]